MTTDQGYIAQYRLNEIMDFSVKQSRDVNFTVDSKNTEAYPAGNKIGDLVRLHRLCVSRKVTTVLEFGCGYSTQILAHAMLHNRDAYADFVKKNLRRNNPFEVHTLDDMPRYLEIVRARMTEPYKSRVTLYDSPVVMTTFNGRICTEYQTLPNICPDFIYLDGPSQASAGGAINGISTDHPDRLPMACDILKIEHFLLPGTLIVVDGRTANARFLKCNLQRAWAYRHDEENEVHLFELQERPLGRYNAKQLEFCLPGGFLL
jgi:hypothetical protein